MESYEYESLAHDEIRIFELLPKMTSDDLVHISIRSVKLSNTGPYLTLSYPWDRVFEDGSHLTDFIHVDGRPLRVMATLHAALCRLRDCLEENPGWRIQDKPWWAAFDSGSETLSKVRPSMWVDAICINQRDQEERSRQVKKMYDIYQKSIHLIIWLGAHFLDTYEYYRKTRHDSLPGSDSRKILHQSALHDMLQSPWFSRRWVIQETFAKRGDMSVLGQGVLYHQTQLCDDFVSTVGNFKGGRKMAQRDMACLLWDLKRIHMPQDMLYNLHVYSYADCTDPRDRIFSLIGISLDGALSLVDYVRTTEQVYLSLATICIYQGLLERLLLSALLHPAAISQTDWPSWVPDWRHSRSIKHAERAFRDAVSQTGTKSSTQIVLPTIEIVSIETCHLLAAKMWTMNAYAVDPEPSHDGTKSGNIIATLETLTRAFVLSPAEGFEGADAFKLVDCADGVVSWRSKGRHGRTMHPCYRAQESNTDMVFTSVRLIHIM